MNMAPIANQDLIMEKISYTNDICHSNCGMHRYGLLDANVSSVDIALLGKCLISIVDMFAGIDTDTYTIKCAESYIYCDGALDVCICKIEEAIDSEVKNTPGYGTTRKGALGDGIRIRAASRVTFANTIMRLCTFWDECKMIYTIPHTRMITFSDSWLNKLAKAGTNIDEIEKVVTNLETCELEDSDMSSDADSDAWMDAW